MMPWAAWGGEKGANPSAVAENISISEQDERMEPYIETHPNGRIDWDKGVIYGVGLGYLDKNGGSKNRAMHAGRVIALQSILKIASGLRLDDRETLQTLGNGQVVVQLQALIRYDLHEVRFLKNSARPHIEVTLRASLTGIEGLTAKLLDYLKGSSIPWEKFPKPFDPVESPPGEDAVETWLVLDTRKLPKDQKVQPALFPKILSPLGEPLYDLTKVDKFALVRQGMAKYVVSSASGKDLRSHRESTPGILSQLKAIFAIRDAMAKEKKKRKKRRRFIITDVQQAKGLNQTDLMLSKEDVKKLKTGEMAENILKNCRVIIVVNSPIGGIEGSLIHLLASSER